MKYRKKPPVVEAIQWKGDNITEIEFFTHYNVKPIAYDSDGNVTKRALSSGGYVRELKNLDYVLKFPDGRIEVWSSEVFEDFYEKVGE